MLSVRYASSSRSPAPPAGPERSRAARELVSTGILCSSSRPPRERGSARRERGRAEIVCAPCPRGVHYPDAVARHMGKSTHGLVTRGFDDTQQEE
eukprot:scaffold3735_cov72-Phaeocystis_antarctica.AAC.1